MGKVIRVDFGGPRRSEEPSEQQAKKENVGLEFALPENNRRDYLLRIADELLTKKQLMHTIVNGEFGQQAYQDAYRRLSMSNLSNRELVRLVLNATEEQMKTKPAHYAALHNLLNARWEEIVMDNTLFDEDEE